jgi:hypothetical protein
MTCPRLDDRPVPQSEEKPRLPGVRPFQAHDVGTGHQRRIDKSGVSRQIVDNLIPDG